MSVTYRGKTFPWYNKPIKSDREGKKKMVLAKDWDRIKLIHFGDANMSDFTKHKNDDRRKNYLARSAGIKDKDGKLTKNDKMSANFWARKILR